MTHNELLRRVVEAHINRLSIKQRTKYLYSYMMDDYRGCDMEELEDWLKTFTRQ